jgi:hypothetical protein
MSLISGISDYSSLHKMHLSFNILINYRYFIADYSEYADDYVKNHKSRENGTASKKGRSQEVRIMRHEAYFAIRRTDES